MRTFFRGLFILTAWLAVFLFGRLIVTKLFNLFGYGIIGTPENKQFFWYKKSPSKS